MIVRMKEGAKKSSIQRVVRRAIKEDLETLTRRESPFFVAILGINGSLKIDPLVFINMPDVDEVIVTSKPLETAKDLGLPVLDLDEGWVVLQ